MWCTEGEENYPQDKSFLGILNISGVSQAGVEVRNEAF